MCQITGCIYTFYDSNIGLCIRRESKKWYFDYGAEVKSSENMENNWMMISNREISGNPHIRCVWLLETEHDPSLLDSVSGTLASVVVIINNMDSFQLDASVYSMCSLPIIVLCSSSGNVLKAIFESRSETLVDAMISTNPIPVEICKPNLLA